MLTYLTADPDNAAACRAALRRAVAEGIPALLLCRRTTVFPDGQQDALLAAAEAAPQAALLAARVLPYGPEWPCDPVTLETELAGPDGVLLRTAALTAAGGFDARLSGEAMAADLCWRLRGAGGKLLYCPSVTAWDKAADRPETAADYAGRTASAARLLARYGRRADGAALLWETLRAPKHFDGVRRTLLAALPAAAAGSLCRRAPAAARALADLSDGYGPRLGRCALLPFEEQPLVSIIVRTCDRADTLRETLRCLRHQTYKNFEIVLIEDGAPTAQQMVQTEFADLPIRYHATGTRVGRGRAGNLGIELAQGEYVSFLDDDDFYYPDFIELHLAYLLNGPREGFVISSIMAFEVDVESRSPYVYTIRKRYPVIFDHITLMDMCVKCRIPMTGGMFRRSLYDVCGGMREDIDGDEDWAMWLRFWRTTHRAANTPEVCRAVSMFGYPADPAKAAARLAAYEVYDEQMLADPTLVFDCTAEEIALWQRTVAADAAHLAALGRQEELRDAAAKHPQAALPASDAPVRQLTAQQINRYYWYLAAQAVQGIPAAQQEVPHAN